LPIIVNDVVIAAAAAAILAMCQAPCTSFMPHISPVRLNTVNDTHFTVESGF